MRLDSLFRLRPRLWRRFWRDARGVTAIEFGMIAVPFFSLLLMTMETGLVAFEQESLEAATQTAARNLMTGTAQGANVITADSFRQTYLCPTSGARVLPSFIDCSKLIIDIRTAASFTSADTSRSFYQDATQLKYCPGGPQTIVVVRIAYGMPVFLPFLAVLSDGKIGQSTAGLVNDIPNAPGWRHLLIGTAVFQNEPYTAVGSTPC